MNELSKRVLLINIVISQVLVVGLGLLLINTLFQDISLLYLFRLEVNTTIIGIVIIGSGLLILLQLLFHKFLTSEKLFDEINLILIDRFNLRELFLIFLFGSIAEEFLFRAILQPELGIWITSILFTITHYRYYKKFYILAEVFFMSVILGYTYAFTSLLWAPIVCHFGEIGRAHV